jgi:hypothetical protein
MFKSGTFLKIPHPLPPYFRNPINIYGGLSILRSLIIVLTWKMKYLLWLVVKKASSFQSKKPIPYFFPQKRGPLTNQKIPFPFTSPHSH